MSLLVRFGRWMYRISDAVLITFGLAALASSPFYHVAEVRSELIGASVAPPFAAFAVLCLGLGIAGRSLLRRDFVWQDPAKLTWSDGSDARIGAIGRRLWSGWAIRFALVAYATAGGAVLFGGSLDWVRVGVALFAGVAILALVTARRRATTRVRWIEQAASLLLPLLGGLLAVWSVAPLWLWTAVGLAGAAALALLYGSGPPRRPAAAREARRSELVARFNDRLVRRMSVAFLDLLALLPAPRPMPWSRLFAGPAIVVRFVIAGVLARRASLLLGVLLVWAVAVVHLVFPLLSPVWLVGVAAYFAALPFAALLAKLHQQPGLRRWLGCTDLDLRLATTGLVVAVVVVWLALVVVFGIPLTPPIMLAALLACGAVIRTASRPALDYGNVGVAVSPDGNLVPFGLIVQLIRGPEVLIVGLLIADSGFTIGPKALICAVIAVFAALR
ncbi:MAG TPA: hypothetical protein VHX38_07795 [Pseudonocardiaceae bacterium]|nr:hypothetical protein [Pseudonocardiaceae bacterium]